MAVLAPTIDRIFECAELTRIFCVSDVLSMRVRCFEIPLVDVRSYNLPDISAADYNELGDFTGRELHSGNQGKIAANEPKALTKLGLNKNHWATRAKGRVRCNALLADYSDAVPCIAKFRIEFFLPTSCRIHGYINDTANIIWGFNATFH